MELLKFTAKEAADMLHSKEVSCCELTKASLEQIKAKNDSINAYITVCEEEAMQQAEQVDAKIAAGEPLQTLAGVPYAIKDNICTKGVRTTCASKMLGNFVPPYNAYVADKLGQDGVMLGKLNMDEFAMGSSNETSYFGAVHNPYNLKRVPGGSSGGSAAAVAAGMAYYALGSDTGGSIRLPASFCGVTGLKPTYGTVSRFGLVAFASSLDQIGPLAKSAEDVAYIMNRITGHDNMDSTSLDIAYPDYTKSLQGDVKGLKIALVREYFDGADAEVDAAVKAAVKQLTDMGAQCDEISMPVTDYALPAYYIISSSEASSNLARYDGVKYGFRAENFDDLTDMYFKTRDEGFGDEVKRRIMLGTYALSSGYYDAYYKKAQQVRTMIKQGFDKVFETYDVIASPVYPTTAFGIGEKTDDPVKMYAGDLCTVSVNIAGLPGISLPCGFDGKGLPIGLQLIGKPFGEETLLRAAHTFQCATDYHKGGVQA